MQKRLKVGVLGSPTGWYVADLSRAASRIETISTELESDRVATYRVAIEIDSLAFDHLSTTSRTAPSARTWSYSANRYVELNQYDVILVRTMPIGSLEQVIFRMNALHAAEAAGVLVRNAPRCLEVSIDKWLTLECARSEGLLVPNTICCQTREQAMEAWKELGEDCVVKPIFGGEGRGIMRLSDPDLAWRAFSTLENLQSVIYLQEFIDSGGLDLRLLVIGQKIISVQRQSRDGWKANVSLGGTASPYLPTFEQIDMAYRVARKVGGWMVGVDILPAFNQNYLIEVNAVPGWRGTGTAWNLDIAREVLESLALEICSKGDCV